MKSITSYGVFVDLGGLDGLLHVSDLSWGRVTNSADVVRPGEEIDVQVLKFDREKLRVSLGRRQLVPDPWATVPERLPVGARAQGRTWASRITAALSSSMRRSGPGTRLRNELVDAQTAPQQAGASRRSSRSGGARAYRSAAILLGIKQAQPDPWSELAKKYPVGSQVSGRSATSPNSGPSWKSRKASTASST